MSIFSDILGLSGVHLGILLCLFFYSTYKTYQSESDKCFLTQLYKEVKRNKQTYFAVILHIFDQASDWEACILYYQQWKKSNGFNDELKLNPFWWFIGTVLIIVVHRVISTIVIWLETRNPLNTGLQLLDLALVRAVYEGLSEQREEPGNVERILLTMEAIFESFPQVVFSMVYLLRTNEINQTIIIQALFSIYTLSLRICSDDAAFFPEEWRKAHPRFKCPPSMNHLWLSRVFLFRVPEIFQRVAVISLFWALVGGDWLCVLIPLDFSLCKLASLVSEKLNHQTNQDWNPLSLDFYSYLLCFKPGIDNPTVWLFVRPLLSLFYVSAAINFSLDYYPERSVIISSLLGSIMINCVMLCTFMTWPFMVLFGNGTLDSFIHEGVAKRGIQTQIEKKQWDELSEFLQFGANRSYILEKITLPLLLKLIISEKHWEFLDEFFLVNDNDDDGDTCDLNCFVCRKKSESTGFTVMSHLWNKHHDSEQRDRHLQYFLDDLFSLKSSLNFSDFDGVSKYELHSFIEEMEQLFDEWNDHGCEDEMEEMLQLKFKENHRDCDLIDDSVSELQMAPVSKAILKSVESESFLQMRIHLSFDEDEEQSDHESSSIIGEVVSPLSYYPGFRDGSRLYDTTNLNRNPPMIVEDSMELARNMSGSHSDRAYEAVVCSDMDTEPMMKLIEEEEIVIDDNDEYDSNIIHSNDQLLSDYRNEEKEMRPKWQIDLLDRMGFNESQITAIVNKFGATQEDIAVNITSMDTFKGFSDIVILTQLKKPQMRALVNLAEQWRNTLY